MKKNITLALMLAVGCGVCVIWGSEAFKSVEAVKTATIKQEIVAPTLEPVISVYVQELFNATNRERQTLGIGKLALSAALVRSAELKCQDMQTKNYWAHDAPDGTKPWVFFRQAGYDYSEAGENLAKGFITAEQVDQGWMNSKAHHDNMLNPEFTDVGYATCQGVMVNLVVQHLGKL